MKKITIILMSLILVFSLAACGNDQPSQSSTAEPASEPVSEDVSEEENSNTTAESDTEQQEEAEEGTTGDGKVLVVYYSATGNTKEVADFIAATTNADIFELEPSEPYSDGDLNWTDENSRVVYEHDNPDARDVELVSATPDEWESYDTVFIGYPIWWGIAAWPVDTFIKANDFTGKTVIPFCTSSSSDLGESGKLLEEMAGTGNWLEGERFSSGASEEDVKAWVGGLGL